MDPNSQPEPNAPEPNQPPADEKPPWGDDFDPEKAWNLVKNLRADKEKLAGRPVLDDDAKQKLSEYDRLVEASKTELERKSEEAARWQSEAEQWRTRSVASTIQALAAADYADPSDAVNALDPSKYLDAGGTIDEQAIKKDLAELLDKKPHYKRSTEAPTPRVPAPNPAQGSQGGGPPDKAAIFGTLLQERLR